MNASQKSDLERYHANALWFGEHYEELKALYPDQWVGIRDKKVMGSHEHPELLMIELKSKGVSLKTIYFHFLPTEEKAWVFTPFG